MEKRQFQIVTDSSSDMTNEYFTANGVECVNLGFTLNGENYCGEDGKPIEIKEFYDLMRGGAMPTTYQVASEIAKIHIEKYLKQGKDVFVLAFSGGLSGTAGSFAVAARDLQADYPERKIEVVDSLCAAMGEGLLLDYVVKKADEGATIEELKSYAEDLKMQICHEFTVDDLNHLKRGGRVSATTAFVGTILKIKPVMHVDNLGKLVPVGKAMGRKKSIQAMADNMEKAQALEKGEPIFISHGDCMEDVEYLKAILTQRYPENPITVGYVGAVIGSHTGAGVLALFYRGKAREL